MAEAVRVAELTRHFGSFVAVDRVSFTVTEGEIFGFLGPNGAGKTTTIKMLTGLLPPTSGRARVAGHDIETEITLVKHKLGYMSQLFSLYGDLTVDENIELFGALYGVTGSRLRARRDWVLAMAGLTGKHDRLTAELPLGWKQRLALGCAVLHEPPILFLDEPTSGVDPISRRAFWDLIYELAAGGTTVFVSTHYMEEAEYCYRLALMNRGRLIALDRPTALKRAMVEPIVALKTDDPARAVEALRGTPNVIEAAMFGRQVHVVVADEGSAARDIPATLAAHGRRVDAIERITPSLEDVFVALVRKEGGAIAG
ncbi:MAG: ABC transporter ATP-binding protein [Gemmatimonadetes bacterium]|nr:ABC transporter ATP-binding protein [Gemmatimonadota bacterium]